MRSAYKCLFLLLSLLIGFGFNNVLAAEPQNGQNTDQEFERGRQAYQVKDYELALKTFKPLAKAGYPKAQIYLGTIYDKGLGVARDLKRAMYWFEKSAEQGGVKLQYDLGARYLHGKDVVHDYGKAIYWWRKAADAGSSQAQYNLALLYIRGEGIEVDHGKAIELFRLAAEQGLADAQYALGLAYTTGQSLPLDYDEAYRLFELAAKQGYPSAQYNIGALTESGEGTTADINKAIYWYRKAAEQGHEFAQERLAQLEGQLGELDKKDSSVTVTDKQTEKASALDIGKIHDRAWIKSQPASHYTIQINLTHDKEDLVHWLKSLQPLAPLAYYPQQLDGEIVYKAIYGSFSDAETARKALNELPAELVELKPWLRRFSSVHAQLDDSL